MKRILFLPLLFVGLFLGAQQSPDFSIPWYTVTPALNISDGQLVDYFHSYTQTAQAWADNKGEGAVIFIVDTGLPSHPDLSNEGSQFAFNGTPEPINDVNNHASACGGVAAGLDNAYGTVGIAPKTLVIYMKGLRGNGQGFTNEIVSCVRRIADIDLGVYNSRQRIISMSFGGSAPIPELEDALKYAESKGCILVSSAGNSGYVEGGNTIGYPARYPFVISVGSVGPSLAPSWFSSGGQGLVVTCFGEEVYSCNAQGSYSRFSGTSFSGPMVAGILALVTTKHLQEFKSAGAKANQLAMEFLKKYATDIFTPGYDPRTGYGLPKATILSNPVPPLGDTPVDPPVAERTISVKLLPKYTMLWRANNSNTFNTSYLTLTVDFKNKKPAPKAIAELEAATAGFWTNRGFVLLDNDDMWEAVFWARHFYELIMGQMGYSVRVTEATISDGVSSPLVLGNLIRRTQGQSKAAVKARMEQKVQSFISDQIGWMKEMDSAYPWMIEGQLKNIDLTLPYRSNVYLGSNLPFDPRSTLKILSNYYLIED